MITEFQNEYRWLSNFAPVKIKLDGLEFPSVEHAYMSAKSDDIEWKKFCSNQAWCKTRIICRALFHRHDWEYLGREDDLIWSRKSDGSPMRYLKSYINNLK